MTFASVNLTAPPSTFMSVLICVRSFNHFASALSEDASAHQSDKAWRTRVKRNTPWISLPFPIILPPGSPLGSGGTATLPSVISETISPKPSSLAPTCSTIARPTGLPICATLATLIPEPTMPLPMGGPPPVPLATGAAKSKAPGTFEMGRSA